MSLTCAEKQARLAVLEARWDTLLTHGPVIGIRDGENELSYGATIDRDALWHELNLYRDLVAACTGETRNARRAIQFIPY